GHWLMVATSVVLLMMAVSLGRGSRRTPKAPQAAEARSAAPVVVAAGAGAAGGTVAKAAAATSAPRRAAAGHDGGPRSSGITVRVAAELVGVGALSGALAGL